MQCSTTPRRFRLYNRLGATGPAPQGRKSVIPARSDQAISIAVAAVWPPFTGWIGGNRHVQMPHWTGSASAPTGSGVARYRWDQGNEREKGHRRKLAAALHRHAAR